ncbi:DUF748 domain-containing protein [Sandaracinobacter neustonicus]|uniref:DUF748 domain-containing protein n=1 Tax=Sandaracinobacter neustonicus TaxID=1715348 RepID=A0A501XMA1_9SPHN|nr:DUF748 domain-containing protein [Sandaracinobacter neustonicus]TPE61565.1 DUF748 domain-containing protein [Sandaracinobacter neustonicus]
MADQPEGQLVSDAHGPGAASSHRGRNLLLALVGGALLLLLAYWAAGRFLAPRLIEDQAKAWTKEKLGLDLALGEVKVDPFGFKVTLSGIAIPAAQPMVSVERLHLDFDIRSVFADSYRFDLVEVDAPRLNAVIGADGKLNLLKLVPPPSPDPMPAVLISELKVAGGRADFADLSKPNKPEAHLAPVAFSIQNLHTTRDEGGGFRLAATSDKGEVFLLKGTASMAPIHSHGGLVIRSLKAESIQDFFGQQLPLGLSKGLVDLDLAYAVKYGDDGLTAAAELPTLGVRGLDVAGNPKLLNADLSLGSVRLANIRADARMPAGGELASSASVGGIALKDIALTGTGAAAGQKLALKSADIERVSMDPATSAISIGALRLSGLDTSVTRDAKGGISLMKLVPASTSPASDKPAAPMPLVGEFSLSDARIHFVDQAVRPAASWTVTPLTVTARGETAGGPLKLTVDGRLNGSTPFALAGDVNPATPSADLKVRLANFPVKAVVPYTVDFPRLEIVSGTASADGRLRYGPKLASYSGAASVDNLKLVETYQGSDLVSWKRLALSGIEATPARATVDRVRVSQPYGAVIILQDGTVNFQRLVTMNPQPVVTPAADAGPPPKLTRAQRREQEKQAAAEKAATSAKARAALVAPIREPDIPVLVRRIDVEGGTMNFADHSLRPNFAAKVQGINGAILNVSNSPRGVAKMKLNGYVIDKFSPVTIAGELTPLQYDRRTHVDMAFRNIELPVFNPYSGRWAGYSIAKGKLTTELSYAIDNRALDAKHHIIIDQLEWGDATDSKEKVSMPIKFATSLLKDKNGVIDLDVPVTGSLDDPSFKLGPIIWKVIGNLFEKVLTAPFRALGDLFGGKEDVQFVDFAPGSAAVPDEAKTNLSGIAKGLADKPELRLDIPAAPGLKLDALGLADQKIATAAMAKEVKKGQPADLGSLELATRLDRLQDLYKARFKTGPKYPEGPKDEPKDDRRTREIEWLTAELRNSYAPTPDELAALGKARAEAVRVALLEGGAQVDPARLFISTRDAATEKDGKVRMELKLEGS